MQELDSLLRHRIELLSLYAKISNQENSCGSSNILSRLDIIDECIAKLTKQPTKQEQ